MKYALTETEQEFIVRSRSFVELSQSAAWQELSDHMQSLVDEADRDLHECISSDANIHMMRNIRLQQRSSVVKAIQNYIDTMLSERKRLLSEMSDPHGDQSGNTSNTPSSSDLDAIFSGI